MRFVKTEELKAGMRLAKPIYNRTGVLLYDRNSELTAPGINSVRNFGLIGVYILEPAEPVPPLSKEDFLFEQSQTIYMFQLREQMELIYKRKKIDNFPKLVKDILKKYGSLDHRVNFNQNLRSAEDFIYKHSISTAILIAMMTSNIEYTVKKQKEMVTAALLLNYGYSFVPKSIIEKGTRLTQADKDIVQKFLEKGIEYISIYEDDNEIFKKAIPLITAYIYSQNPAKASKVEPDMLYQMQLLKVAEDFDKMTAMNLNHEPESEIQAMERLQQNHDLYHPDAVKVLAECIHIVPRAASVDLSTGDKGIVIVENPIDYIHPVILRLSDNVVYDLSNRAVASRIWIVDIMKTMDNRIVVDEDTLKQFVPDQRLTRLTKEITQKIALSRQINSDEQLFKFENML